MINSKLDAFYFPQNINLILSDNFLRRVVYILDILFIRYFNEKLNTCCNT